MSSKKHNNKPVQQKNKIFTKKVVKSILIIVLVSAVLLTGLGVTSFLINRNAELQAVKLSINKVLTDNTLDAFFLFRNSLQDKIVLLKNQYQLGDEMLGERQFTVMTPQQLEEYSKEIGAFLYLSIKEVDVNPLSIDVTIQNLDSTGLEHIGGEATVRIFTAFGNVTDAKVVDSRIYE